MAAPASKTIGDLGGKWVLVSFILIFVPGHDTYLLYPLTALKEWFGVYPLNKTLSDPTDPALALQGIGWLLRKGIGAATVTIQVRQYADAASATHIDIEQSASGLTGTTENRVLDWTAREHKDWLFGRVHGRSKFVTPAELAALLAPGGEARGEGWVDSDFLAQDWRDGDGDGDRFVLNHVRADAGWFATQVWGFQDIGGERRYVRNVVVAKGDKFESFKMIYDFVSE
ncbi:hypothetical protein GQX73_g10186 [Xylaria multiplex]|uniref:Uncharacterized protein n=1 Tax=Xylaria multiplex TaxID=323545 RepID=A0A7C8MXN8_9PEZI|nr:hypothetical protein GQX73_g10186 [Xylaria multiplex]